MLELNHPCNAMVVGGRLESSGSEMSRARRGVSVPRTGVSTPAVLWRVRPLRDVGLKRGRGTCRAIVGNSMVT
jgi:hypothetical protein